MGTAVAVRWIGASERGAFPAERDWRATSELAFDADWRGQNADPQRRTEVRLLWTPETLHVQFKARYRSITAFADSTSDGRTDRLWERDVCEAFFAPDASHPYMYKEFEVAPNGLWIDLDIVTKSKRDLRSGLRRQVRIDEANKTWQAMLAIPMTSLTASFDVTQTWRANFFRVEGPREPRFYSAWQPTHTPEPDFHCPAAFGTLTFLE